MAHTDLHLSHHVLHRATSIHSTLKCWGCSQTTIEAACRAGTCGTESMRDLRLTARNKRTVPFTVCHHYLHLRPTVIDRSQQLQDQLINSHFGALSVNIPTAFHYDLWLNIVMAARRTAGVIYQKCPVNQSTIVVQMIRRTKGVDLRWTIREVDLSMQTAFTAVCWYRPAICSSMAATRLSSEPTGAYERRAVQLGMASSKKCL